MTGKEVWLIGERRSTGEQKYYVSNLPPDENLKKLAATIKAGWVSWIPSFMCQTRRSCRAHDDRKLEMKQNEVIQTN
ncbi:MAG: hypothetical protein ACR652_18345 [Methylocystis sp.]|uniref:hypothetical protein n=1 Tax=Methylocystis sp. TaxID=1911079 RepID=UPI003DA2E690